eukprot:g2285.t1
MKLWIAMLSACALAQDFEDAELLAAVEAEDCFSEDCDAAALHLAQLRATYYKEQTETVPKYQYFPSEDLDLDYALQEDSDSAINFVQTSAQYALFGQYMSEATSAMMGLIEDAFPWPRSGVIADIGGGNGHLLRALLQKGAAQGVLFDLPSVIETSRQHWPDGDLMRGSSVTYMPGSFLEAVPVKADIYVLKWILHDWSDADCIRILSNLQASAPKESQVVVIDMLVPEDQPNQYHVAKFFDVHMAIGYGGKERTVAEMRSLAKASGFVMVEVLPVGRSPFACFVLKKSEAEL